MKNVNRQDFKVQEFGWFVIESFNIGLSVLRLHDTAVSGSKLHTHTHSWSLINAFDFFTSHKTEDNLKAFVQPITQL